LVLGTKNSTSSLAKVDVIHNLFHICKTFYGLIDIECVEATANVEVKESSFVSSVILSKYFGDLLSGVMQLSYSPTLYPEKDTSDVISLQSLMKESSAMLYTLFERLVRQTTVSVYTL
jgi:hypothetical protein